MLGFFAQDRGICPSPPHRSPAARSDLRRPDASTRAVGTGAFLCTALCGIGQHVFVGLLDRFQPAGGR